MAVFDRKVFDPKVFDTGRASPAGSLGPWPEKKKHGPDHGLVAELNRQAQERLDQLTVLKLAEDAAEQLRIAAQAELAKEQAKVGRELTPAERARIYDLFKVPQSFTPPAQIVEPTKQEIRQATEEEELVLLLLLAQ